MKTYSGKYLEVYEALKTGNICDVGIMNATESNRLRVRDITIMMIPRLTSQKKGNLAKSEWYFTSTPKEFYHARLTEVCSVFGYPLEFLQEKSPDNEEDYQCTMVRHLFTKEKFNMNESGDAFHTLATIYAATNHAGYLASTAQKRKVKSKGLYELVETKAETTDLNTATIDLDTW